MAQALEQIGPLRGKLGFFAGAWARTERATAWRAAKAAVFTLDYIAPGETKAAQACRSSVAAQRRADAVAIPRLSNRAVAVVTRLTTAPDEAARAAVWQGMTADAGVAREVEGFREAGWPRFGDDAVRATVRNQGWPIEVAAVRPEHRVALSTISRTVHVLEEGAFARESQLRTERLAQRQVLGYRPGLGRCRVTYQLADDTDGGTRAIVRLCPVIYSTSERRGHTVALARLTWVTAGA